MLRINKYAGTAIVIFLFAAVLVSVVFSTDGKKDDPGMETLKKKAERLQVLIEEKASQGFNLSEVLRLDQLSREAAERGDIVLTNKLLDDAIRKLSSLTEKDKDAKKSLDLAVSTKTVRITPGVPQYESGEKVTDYTSAFTTKTVEAKAGKVSLEVSSVPVFIEEDDGRQPERGRPEDSPFGFHPANTYKTPVNRNADRMLPPSKIGFVYDNALDIGVKWTRPEFYAIWSFIQKTDEDIKKGVFDWSENDYVFKTVPKGMNIVGNIALDAGAVPGFAERTLRGRDPFPRTFTFKSKEYEEQYMDFVKRLVERYDGDGIADAPGLQSPVKYWQVENEPDLRSCDTDGYAHLMEITCKTVKASCPECRVIMGGLAQGEAGFKNFFLPALEKLSGRYVDIFDFHVYGIAGSWHYYKLLNTIKAGLFINGFTKTEVWILETGTYSGKPLIVGGLGGLRTAEQTERQQAADLIKRYVYGLSLGLKKIFWAFGLVEGFTPEGNNEFDHTGLILRRESAAKGGETEIKKLGYYAYKKMVEKLEGYNSSDIKDLSPGQGIHAYRFNRDGKYVHVVWAD